MALPQEPMTQDLAAAGMGAHQPQEVDGGYEICITVTQGQIMVGVKQPGMANPDGVAPDSGMEPAASIKDALTKALEIYKADGMMAPAGENAAAFKSGFDGPM